jgi:hypothetical protein
MEEGEVVPGDGDRRIEAEVAAVGAVERGEMSFTAMPMSPSKLRPISWMRAASMLCAELCEGGTNCCCGRGAWYCCGIGTAWIIFGGA